MNNYLDKPYHKEHANKSTNRFVSLQITRCVETVPKKNATYSRTNTVKTDTTVLYMEAIL